LNIKTSLTFTISSSYEELAKRLIAINSTVAFIFLVIIAALIGKEKRLRKKMDGEKQEERHD
jgi:hypothetical protein